MTSREIFSIGVNGSKVQGDLVLPDPADGIVLFAHGSGSGRTSPRNRSVASRLQHAGLATLLFDLLTEEEEVTDRQTGHLRFDIDLLAGRLVIATEFLTAEPRLRQLNLGLFGASTGAAAALVAAARLDDRVSAVVSRGGRPDLAGPALERVIAPTLLIVGGSDSVVLDLNRQAAAALRCENSLEVIPGATHLFEEPGALEQVAALAAGWFTAHR